MSATRLLPALLVLLATAWFPAHGEFCRPGDDETQSDRQQVDAATLVVVVDGMMKSRSGAT